MRAVREMMACNNAALLNFHEAFWVGSVLLVSGRQGDTLEPNFTPETMTVVMIPKAAMVSSPVLR